MSQSPYQNPESMHDNLGGFNTHEDDFRSWEAQLEPSETTLPQADLGEVGQNTIETLQAQPVGAAALREEVNVPGIAEDGAFELTNEDHAFLQESGIESGTLTNEMGAEEAARLEIIDRVGQLAAIAYFAEQEARQ